jgi:predicted RNA-binding Zn-ribbon protein involved in translation (DUF1610 family)
MSNYLNTIYPKSNKIAGTHYYILIEGHGIHRAESFDDMETLVQQASWHKQTIKKAVIMQNGLPTEFVPETSQERFNRIEGGERCQAIAEEIDAYSDGYMYKCPECGEIVQMPEDVGDKFKCYQCGETREIEEFEQLSVYDYLDDILDIDFTVNRYKEYQSCSICIGFGGPNIFIDTADAYIKLHWGSTRKRYPIKYSTCDNIDDWAREYWDCI